MVELGRTHIVQIVDVDVLSIVDSTVFTCWVGLPLVGVIALVTGHEVTVVKTLGHGLVYSIYNTG